VFLRFRFPGGDWTWLLDVEPKKVQGAVHYPSKQMIANEDIISLVHELVHIFEEEYYPFQNRSTEDEVEFLAVAVSDFLERNQKLLIKILNNLR